MKKIFTLFAAFVMVCSLMANDAQYTVTLAGAVWNFDDYSNTKSTLDDEHFLCPNTWIVKNLGTSPRGMRAYTPYIYPNTYNTTDSKGYDGRFCMYFMSIKGTARNPLFAMLPSISDATYGNLELKFYGKTESGSVTSPNAGTIRVGYLTSLGDTTAAGFVANVQNLSDITCTATYKQYTVSLTTVPFGAHIVFYMDDTETLSKVLLDNISIATVGGADPIVPVVPAEDYDSLSTMYTPVPGVATFDEIRLPSAGYIEAFKDFNVGANVWQSGSYRFATYVDDYGPTGKYYYDFCLASLVGQTTATGFTSDQTFRITAAEAHSGSNYVVWYNNFHASNPSVMTGVKTLDGSAQVIPGFYVTNTTKVIDAIQNGDGMSSVAGGFTATDTLVLIITGYAVDLQTVTGTVKFLLAGNGTYVSDWTYVDLSSLGAVAQLKFAMDGTKRNEYGMTTPTYFAMDDFGAVNPNGPTTSVSTTSADKVAAKKVIVDGRVLIERDGCFYDLTGNRVH